MILQNIFRIDVSKKCAVAQNGREAVNIVDDDITENGICTYSIILMDCQMPIMDGYTASIKIREMSSHLEVAPLILACTGKS